MPSPNERGPLLRAIDRSEARAALPPQPPMPRCKDGTLAHFWEFGYSREPVVHGECRRCHHVRLFANHFEAFTVRDLVLAGNK